MLTLGNKLTLNSQPIYKFVNKYSIDFDGVDDRIVTDGADTVIQNTTYSFWCKSSTTTANQGVFGHGASAIGGFHFNGDGTRPLLYLAGATFRYWNDTPAQDDGEWHHWVVYLDTDINNSKLYVDGVLQTPSYTISNDPPQAYTESLTIGSDRQVGGNSFEGKIDEFAVYDRELTQAEITRMYNTYYSPNRIANGNFAQIGNEEVSNGDFSQIGSEEVTNGDFSQIGSELLSQPVDLQTDFTAVNGASFTDANTLVTTGGSIEGFTKTSFLTLGKTYKLIIAGTTTSSGFTLGNTTGSGNEYGSGFGTHYFTASGNTAFWLRQNTAGTTNITSFSIKEVVGWVFESSWSIIGDKANYDAVTSQHYLKQTMSSIAAGKTVKIQFDISDVEAGKNAFFKLEISGTPEVVFTYTTFTEGTYTYYHKITGGLDRLNFVPATSGTGGSFSIDNVSVKEVGQDWTIGNGWSVGDNKLVSVNGDNYVTYQAAILTTGKTYKISYEVKDYVSGTFGIRANTTGGITVTANGTYTDYITSNGTTLYLMGYGTFNGSVTNITVKEVGQHWTFGNVGGNNGWRITDTNAICDTNASVKNRNIASDFSLISGKDYKLTIDILQSEDNMQVLVGSTTLSATLPTGTNLAYEYTISGADHTGGVLAFYAGSSDLQEIDNVVVQELKHDATNLMLNAGAYQSANPLITSTKSMEFDGTDDYLIVNNAYGSFTGSFSCWVNRDNNTGHQYLLDPRGASAGGTGYIYMSSGTDNLVVSSGTKYVDGVAATVVPTDGRWHNVVVTGIALDIDEDLRFGASWSLANELDGKMTEVGLWDRTLTALEVASLYNQGMPTDLLVNRNNYQSGNPTVFNTKQVDFDGTDDYLNAGNVLNLGTADFSISMWVNSSQTTNRIMGKTQDDANRWYIRSTGNKVQFHSKSGGAVTMNLTTTETFPVDTWAHLLISADRDGTVYIYINGVQSSVTASGSATSLDNTGDLTIGKVTFFDSYFDGKISQVGMWNKALTSDEVLSLYNHGLPIDLTTDQAAYESSSNLVGYWRMGSGTLDTYPLIADQTNATLGVELSPNTNFTSNITGWASYNSGTASWDSFNGGSMKMVNDGTNHWLARSSSNFFLDTNSTYIATAKVFITSGYSGGNIYMYAASTFTGASVFYSQADKNITGQWQDIKFVFATASDGQGRLYFRTASPDPANGDIVYVDDVSLKKVQGNPAYMTNQTSTDIENGSPYANIVQNGTFDTDTDWTKGTGVTISGGKANWTNTANNVGVNQNGIITSGKTYKISYTVSNYSSGSIRVRYPFISDTITANGTYTATAEATSTDLFMQGETSGDPNVNLSIDNVTVEEVNTGLQGYWKMGDGTNDEYPVIYDQVDPTLGSEIVTNGNFATEDDWQFSNTSFSAGAITFDANTDWIFQGISFTVGKTYKIVITKTGVGTPRYRTGYAGTDASTKEIQESGTAYFTATSDTNRMQFYGDANSIDYVLNSVSVVEVQGNPATMTNMLKGNITNQYPLTKIRNYYRMGDGILDGYPIIQDQTSPNLAHIPTTNLLPYSENFTTLGWTNNEVTVTTNTVVSPDGTQNASTITPTTVSGTHLISKSTTATNVAMSVYAKANGYNKFRFNSGTSSQGRASFDLSTGTVTASGTYYFDSGMEDVGNGWFRCFLVLKDFTSNNTTLAIEDNSGSVTFTGDGTSGIHLWAAQSEDQLQPTTYIKSDGIAAVRKSSTTNLVPYSEDLSQWTIANGTITPDAIVSPDGTQNADKVVFNNTGLDLKTTITVVAGQRYTISFYIKLESGTGLQGRFYDNSNSTNIEYYDYTSQVQGTEWSKITRSVTAPSGCTEMQIWLIASSSTLVTAYFWGAQFEQQTQAETYAPTYGLPVTINLFTENNYGTMTNMSASDIVEDTP